LQCCNDEEYKGFGETVDYTKSVQESVDSKDPKNSARGDSKSKNLSGNKTQSSMDKGQSNKNLVPAAAETKAPEETVEDEVNFGLSFTSRTFGPLELKADEALEDIQKKVDQAMENAAPLLHQSFEHGYEIRIAEHELVRSTQIKKIGAVTSFVLVRKPKPVEIPVVENTDGEGEQGDQGEGKDAEEEDEE